jgi:PAS domain S-box-containing protein
MHDQHKTKQQLVEEIATLRQSLDALVNYLPEGFFIVDAPDVRIRLASRDCQQMLGVSWKELEGVHDKGHFDYYRIFRPDGTAVEVEQLPLARAISAGEVIRNEEWLFQTTDGRRFPVLCHAGPVRDQQGAIQGAVISWQNISERKQVEQALKRTYDELKRQVAETRLNEARLEAVLQLSHMTETSLRQVSDFALEQAVALTRSKIGYLAFMNDDETALTMHSWSKEAMAECAVSDRPLVYPLETTGLWGEAARQRKPIVTNDYAAPNPLKKGLPEGHVRLGRHMSVPILDGGRVVIVAGVGNKTEDYDESDVRQLTLLMQGVWTLIQRQRVQTELQRHRDHLEQLVEQRTELLRQSDEKHRGLLEACPDAIVMADLNGKILFASRQSAELVGLADQKELIGKRVSDYVAEEDRRRLAEDIPRLIQSGSRRNIEYTAIRQDGTQVPTEVSSAINRDATGQPIAIMVVIRDITERKQTAAALQQSHSELQTIYQGMVDGCVVFDTELSRNVTVNTALCTKLGYTEEEIKVLKPEQKHPAYAHSRMHEYYQTSLQRKNSFIDNVPVFHKDGHLLYFDIATRNAFYNGRRCQLVFFHDVTDRKSAEEELRREHRTLKYLLQSSDHERQTIAYEIHDGLAQQLAGAIMQFQTYSHQKETNPSLATKAYEAGMTMLQQGHFEARRLIAGVRPPILDESGVVAAVGHLVHEQNRLKGPMINYHSRVDFNRLAPTLENAIYRIAQEGLANACQHGKSEKVRVSLVQRENRIRIEIRDWGIGFDTRSVQENRFGLVGIRQRARLLGGKCSIRSIAGKGTRITVELPVVVRD